MRSLSHPFQVPDVLRVVDVTLPTTRARSLGAAPGTPGPAPVNSTKYPISRADTPGFSFVRHPLPLALIFPLLRLGKQSWRTRRLRTCLWAASPRERARVVVKRVLFFDEEGTDDEIRSRLLVQDMQKRYMWLNPDVEDKIAMNMLWYETEDYDVARRRCSGLILKSMGFVDDGM